MIIAGSPFYSIILPLYNRPRQVSKAISSVLNQTYTNFELIVVDDCSTDNSYEIVKEINDKRVKIYQLEKNSGPAAARNYGVNKSSGEYISFLDSDDFYEPFFLEETNKFVLKATSNIALWYTGLLFHEKGIIKHSYWDAKRMESPYLSFLHQLQIGTNSGITIKKDAFVYVNGFNVNLPAAEDTDFFLKFSKYFDFQGIKTPLINIDRNGDDRLSKKFDKIAIAYNLFIPQHMEVINKYPILKKKFYYKMMWLNFHLKDKVKAKYWYDLLKINKLLNYKMVLVYFIYRVLPLTISKRIHVSISNIK